VGRILEQVVKTATVPVTLKIRTGWDNTRKNAVKIAKIARESGVKRVCVHGRTRACRFSGRAEHDTTAEIKSEVSIEVIANGDIGSAAEAVRVLQYTGADGIMIGRAAVGNPWLFRRIRDYLDRGVTADPPTQGEISNTVTSHLQGIYDHYGEYTGVRVARKHISKYCSRIQGFDKVRPYIIREENSDSQMRYVRDFLAAADVMDMAA
jgi:tRNA-dihydrouridine synthase B